MVCRNSKLSSTYSTFARDMSGLEDNQILGLSHALMREGADAEAPTPEEWNAFIDQTIADFRRGNLRINPGSHNPLERLAVARSETPDGRRYYAAQRLVERARRAADAQNELYQTYARELGVPATHASMEFWTHFQDATDNARLTPSAVFSRAFRANPDNANRMVDRRSMYAYEQMEISRAQRDISLETIPAIGEREIISDSSAIAEIGYSAEGNRLEIVLNSNPDHVYAYHMGPGDYEDFRNAESLGHYFATEIRGNSAYQFSTQEDAEASAVLHRCANCGQFAGSAHYCPLDGSEEDLNRDVRLAVEQARARVAGARVPETLNDPARMPLTRTANYPGNAQQGNLRFPTINRVRQEARRSARVLVPVRAAFTGDDTAGIPGGDVTGYVDVEYNGRGAGYSVQPVTAPGDSGTDNLRCTCAEYRANYHCPHIDMVVGRSHSLLNSADTPTPSRVQAANATVSADLTDSFDASVAATNDAATGWRPLSTSLEENPEVFQEMYDDFRAERAAYKDAVAEGITDVEYPVPFIQENAFGGLASRESGRGFGIEIEFSFPAGTSQEERERAIDAIGAELYGEELTHNRHQLGYGASHGVVRTEHTRGWSFENDPSTGSYPGYGGNDPVFGGEIVSPVMYDEPETWANLSKVVSVIKKHGGIASRKSGMHVHVSTGDYNHRVENHNRLLAAYKEHEDLLYRMSSNPDRGRHRGLGFCEPSHVPSTPYSDVGSVNRHHWGHETALNLQSVTGASNDHAEFRTFDSTLEPAVMQAHIGMAVYIAAGATRPGTAELQGGERHRLGERLAENPSRQALTGEAWTASTRPIRRFIDTFVPGSGRDEKDNPRVRQMVALFAMTKWQRSN